MTLDEVHANLGKRVRYRRLGHRSQYGYLSTANARWAFVRYDGDNGAKATDPEQLELLPHGDQPAQLTLGAPDGC